MRKVAESELTAMKKIYVYLSLVLLFASCFPIATLAQGKEPVKCKVKDKILQDVKYRFAYSERSTRQGQPIVALNISVKPENINHEYLVLLARYLNQRFCREERLVVAIFTDYKAAKHFRPDFPEILDAWRGEYFLDRRTGEEYVSFTTIPNYNNNPQSRIRINLGVKNTP